jgi:hypothetical protein
MNVKMLKAAVAGLVLSVSGLANAGLITIDNASFEDANVFDQNNGTYNFSVIGWTGTDFGTMDTLTFMGAAVDGDNNAWSNSPGGTIEQILGDVLTVGSYKLSTWFGERNNVGFVSANAELWAGASLIGAVNVGSVGSDTWVQGSESFWVGNEHAALGQSLKIKLVSGGQQALFDDVKLTHVPEPTTLAIFSLSIFGLVARRIKKKS